MGAIASIFGAREIARGKIDSVGLGVIGSVDWRVPGPLRKLMWLEAAFPCVFVECDGGGFMKADRADDFYRERERTSPGLGNC